MSKKKADSDSQRPAEDQAEPGLSMGEWVDFKKPRRRRFPGPRRVQEPLRLNFSRPAFADLIAHAREGLDEEVCGVLAGELCKDREGLFVQAEAALRGTSSQQGKTHVTFTHQTWDEIHQAMERDHPDLQIVGWYHSHPGFGVEFSEMDLFVQSNFFAGPAQFALVTDPLKGDMAACVNAPDGIRHLSRFWVDGRELPCRVPEEPSPPSSEAADSRIGHSLKELEAQLGLAVDYWEEQWASMRQLLNMVLLLLVFLAAGLAILIGQRMYQGVFSPRIEPPRLRSYVPVPVSIDGKEALLGIGLYKWEIPQELRSPPPAPDGEEKGRPPASGSGQGRQGR